MLVQAYYLLGLRGLVEGVLAPVLLLHLGKEPVVLGQVDLDLSLTDLGVVLAVGQAQVGEEDVVQNLELVALEDHLVDLCGIEQKPRKLDCIFDKG